jgi:hypothetical protein
MMLHLVVLILAVLGSSHVSGKLIMTTGQLRYMALALASLNSAPLCNILHVIIIRCDYHL